MKSPSLLEFLKRYDSPAPVEIKRQGIVMQLTEAEYSNGSLTLTYTGKYGSCKMSAREAAKLEHMGDE